MSVSSAIEQTSQQADATAGAWNPRYLNYAKSHGRSPEEQIAHDREKFPGGPGAGFILWNRSRICEYSKINPRAFTPGGGLADHAGYDAWLSAYAEEAR